MFKRNLNTISHALMVLLGLSLILIGQNPVSARSQQSYYPVTEQSVALSAEPDGAYVLQQVDGSVQCRDATADESTAFNARDESITLQVISPLRANSVTAEDAGLQIILRGTPQLENFPQAK